MVVDALLGHHEWDCLPWHLRCNHLDDQVGGHPFCRIRILGKRLRLTVINSLRFAFGFVLGLFFIVRRDLPSPLTTKKKIKNQTPPCDIS